MTRRRKIQFFAPSVYTGCLPRPSQPEMRPSASQAKPTNSTPGNRSD
jgi:hypothetical protein